jgi:hypothetical protein
LHCSSCSFIIINSFLSHFISFSLLLGGGGPDGGSGGGGSSISFGHNTVYTSGFYLPDYNDGKAIIELFANPFYKFSLCTKQVQNITVPPGTYFLAVDLAGASSGIAGAGLPGLGARVQSYFNVIPGTLLHISVGCSGLPPSAGSSTEGGFNGGGASASQGTSGGGATDIRMGGMALTHRIITAGGGGGYYVGANCGAEKGGNGGRFGQNGLPTTTDATCFSNSLTPPGGGGSWTAGGGAGGSPNSPVATSGSLGFGGNGAAPHSGGGGGGYFGGTVLAKLNNFCIHYNNFLFVFILFLLFVGGGGQVGGSGGGGSSYSTGQSTSYTTGYQTGDGFARLEFFSNPTYSFTTCTKTVQNLTVPVGVNAMSVDITGAASGSGGATGTPGYGARVQSYYPVTPGQVVYVTVGCRGSNSNTAAANTWNYGGFNGGGAAFGYGTGGGGATDIRIGGLDLSSRVITAGGGGGYYYIGDCGAPKGGDGGRIGRNGGAFTCAPTFTVGMGGNWISGGLPGTEEASFVGLAGTLGFGGSGACCHSGGGGGGYFGGNF